MTPTDPPAIDRLYDLLALRETGTLTPAEEAELGQLLSKWPHVEPDELSSVAALLHAATAPAADPSPEFLDRLEAEAASHLPTAIRPRRERLTGSRTALAGWVVAACLLASTGFLIWDRWGHASDPTAERERLISSGARRFLAKAREGDVVWDGGTQRGVLSVSGLPPNDPSKFQYQLWIVDSGRSHKEPVDGGVFDVGPDGRAVVPIRPSLVVRNPVMFALTVEPPGGVVVSERGRAGQFEVVYSE